MRAKFKVQEVANYEGGMQKVSMAPVMDTKYGENGANEDNTFARYTPSGEIRLHITNPELKDKIQPGETYYIDFTPAQ
jgi:hypothetical protein